MATPTPPVRHSEAGFFMEKAMTRAQRKRLPKAMLFCAEWTPRHSYFAKFRLANAMRVQVGPLCLVWRMPWLEHSARTLHPEVFA